MRFLFFLNQSTPSAAEVYRVILEPGQISVSQHIGIVSDEQIFNIGLQLGLRLLNFLLNLRLDRLDLGYCRIPFSLEHHGLFTRLLGCVIRIIPILGDFGKLGLKLV